MTKKGVYLTVSAMFIIYIAAVFFFCLYDFSGADLDMATYFMGIRMDRFVHFCMFLPFPFVSWIFFHYNSHIQIYKEYRFAVIILSGIALASFAEAAQELFTTYRDGDPYDLGANITGILVGSLIVYILRSPLEKICNFLLNAKS